MSVALETAPPRQTDRRQEILSVARELMLAEGFDKTSMRNIAARMGVTPTTLYLYFRNKEDIIFHLIPTCVDQNR
jgi:AcrR family transcriptional regulator